MELKYYLDIFLRRRKLFLAVWIAVIILPFAVALLRSPMYQVTARAIMVKRDVKQLISPAIPDSLATYEYFDVDFVQDNVMEIVRSPIVLRKVLDKLELDSDPKDVYSSLPYLRFLFLGTKPLVKGENISDTNVYEFQGYATSQPLAEKISRAYYTSFTEVWNQMYQESVERMEAGVLARQVELAKELSAAFEKDRKVKLTFGVGDFTQAVQTEYAQVSALKTTLNTAITHYQYLDTEQAEVKKNFKKIPWFRKNTEDFENNPVVQEGKTKLAEAVWALAGLKVTMTEDHPDVKAQLAQIQAIKETLLKEVKKTYKDESVQISAYYDILLQRYYDNEISKFVERQKEQVTRKQIAGLEADIVKLSSQALELSPVSTEETTILNSLANTIKALDTVNLMKKINISHMLRFNPASKEFESRKPYFPRYAILLAFCFFGGLVVAVVSSLLVEYFDSTCKTRLDLEQITRCPVFHTLPWRAADNLAAAAKTGGGPRPPELMALAQDLILARDGAPLVASLASVMDGEGKTTAALMLSSVLAEADYRVLLLDLDPASAQYATLVPGLAQPDSSAQAGPDILSKQMLKDISSRRTLLSWRALPPAQQPRIYPLVAEFLERVKAENSYDFILADLPALSQGTGAYKFLQLSQLTLFLVALGKVDAYQLSKCFYNLPSKGDCQGVMLLANQVRPVDWRFLRPPWIKGRSLS